MMNFSITFTSYWKCLESCKKVTIRWIALFTLRTTEPCIIVFVRLLISYHIQSCINCTGTCQCVHAVIDTWSGYLCVLFLLLCKLRCFLKSLCRMTSLVLLFSFQIKLNILTKTLTKIFSKTHYDLWSSQWNPGNSGRWKFSLRKCLKARRHWGNYIF